MVASKLGELCSLIIINARCQAREMIPTTAGAVRRMFIFHLISMQYIRGWGKRSLS